MKLYKSIIFSAVMFSLAACDTTEDEFYAGTEPTDVLSVSGEIFLNADGTAQTLQVSSIAYWDVAIEQTGNNFTCSANTDHGNGTITVSSSSNYQGSAREAKLIVSARNFNKTVEIPIYQAALQFDMTPESSYPVVSELGGDVTLSFTSTVEWTFTVQPNSANSSDLGNINWLTFTPSLPGEGARRQINAIATWSPNYTEQERVITLALEATNSSVMDRIDKLPDSFTLRQAAGTAPSNLTISNSDVTYNSAVITINYRSVSAVNDCGVMLREAGQDISEARKIPASQASYSTSGPVSITLTGLDEGKTYIAVPYVENMVKEVVADGIETEFITKQHGASVAIIALEAAERNTTIEFTITSDFGISQASMRIYNADGGLSSERSLNLEGIFGADDELKTQDFTISTENDLTPKSDYLVEIALLDAAGNEVAVSERVSFSTKGVIPSGDDNVTPGN